MAQHHDVCPAARANARRMRHEMTDAERVFWFAVRAHRLEGLSFRRQVPMGPYIVDFYCADARLVVEIDGGQHSESAEDAVRDAWLADSGMQVLRFWNNEVLENLEGVLIRVLEIARPDSETLRPVAHPPP